MRRFRIGRVLAVLLALALVAAACGDDDDNGDASGDQGTTDEPTDGDGGDAAEGGELTIAYSFPPSSLDPLAPNQFETYLYPVYDRLTEVNDDFEVQPRLATSWEFPDASTMILELRDDVTFHDGTPFDAEAVKTNLEWSKAAEASAVSSALAGIESVEVVDEYTVQLNLGRGGAELPVLFSALPGMMVSPAVIESSPDSIAQGAGGSGAYIVEEFRPDEGATYTPNPDHWNDEEGHLDRLTINGITVGQQRLNALQAGDVDLVQLTSVDVVTGNNEIEAGRLEGEVVPQTTAQNIMLLRSTQPPFDDIRVREAFAKAIDKEGLEEGLYQGSCVAGDQFFPEGHFAHSEELEDLYEYDPDGAEQLLEDAGVSSPSVVIDYLAIYQEPTVAVQDMVEQVGFDAEANQIVGVDIDFGDGSRQALLHTMFGVIDPSQIVTTYLLGTYDIFENSEEVTQLLTEASNPTLTDEERGEFFQQIWDKAWGEYRVISLCRAQQAWVHDGKIANLEDLRYKFKGTVDVARLRVNG